MSSSYRVMLQIEGEEKLVSNGVRYVTDWDASRAGDHMLTFSGVVGYRIDESDDTPNILNNLGPEAYYFS